ncbi:GDYXXLXY domain-containing protein [uncultured Campylobacter sp.]|uniref:GDYXXLXY domain-containing protein n=1 Tax=uncultured Campylobacter sp. TaxID=218934 RepID=UPI0026042840|nr:GDYXXLXY domain-containing protein [uncultured Campylobacter sp.]
MKNKGLILPFALQFFLIALMFILAFLPVYFGKEVKLLASGYDPRDLLSGHYVRLNYNLNLKADRYMDGKEKFYVSLKQGENGIYTFDKLYENEKPKEGLFIEAKRTYGLNLELKYINKYFATKERALELERKLTGTEVVVTAKVLDGKARIINIESQIGNDKEGGFSLESN